MRGGAVSGSRRRSGGSVAGEFFTWSGSNPTGKLSFVHNYGQFPQSVDDEVPSADYYAVNWLPPTGEDGNHTAYGGWVRNRPLQVGPMRGGPKAQRGGDWQTEGCREDIEQMKLGGCDGMFCNIMALDASINWYDLYDKWRSAANLYYPGFKVVPELDIMANPPINAGNINAIADLLVGYHGLSSTWMVGGTFIVAVFAMEEAPLSFYASLQSALATRGISSTKFAGAFVDYSSPATYTSVMYGSGAWGFGADPAVTATVSTGKAAATARGEKHIAPIQAQDIRPREGDQWTECLNTQNLVATWQKAISEDSPLVQLVTHQDMTEGHEMCGTAARGLVQYEISAFYCAWWKSGVQPTITQDVMFLSYRNHLSTASIVGPQTFEDDQLFAGAGGSTKRYHIEALVFLTAAATVRIKGTDFSAGAGISVWSIPATSGNVTASIIRSAVTVVSMAPAVPIRAGNIWQSTWQYFMFSSLRQNIGQFDPTMTTAGASPTYP